MVKKKYCDWKYILMFILWTFALFYDTNPDQSFGSALIMFLIWIGVSTWIIDQGKESVK